MPSLSFSRWMRKPGSLDSKRKQDSPPGACASVRKTSHIGALVNHLWPVSRYVPSGRGTARVVLARTSEPPCFSVIDMPASSPALSLGSRSPKS